MSEIPRQEWRNLPRLRGSTADPFSEAGSFPRAVCDCVYGSVPRAVASVTQHQARSLPLAVLTQRVFPVYAIANRSRIPGTQGYSLPFPSRSNLNIGAQ